MLTNREEMVATIKEQGIVITELRGTVAQQGIVISQQGIVITQQGLLITELQGASSLACMPHRWRSVDTDDEIRTE